jgi:hypothetical protein
VQTPLSSPLVPQKSRWFLPMAALGFISLRVRLVLLVLLAVLPALGLMFSAHMQQRQLATAAVQESTLRLVRLAATDQDRFIEGTRQLLLTLAQVPEVHTDDPDVCTPLFTNLIKQNPQYTTMGVGRLDGEILCAGIPIKGKNTYIGDRPWFQGAIAQRDFAIGDYQIGRTSGKASINFGYPAWRRRPGAVGRVCWPGPSLAQAICRPGSAAARRHLDPTGLSGQYFGPLSRRSGEGRYTGLRSGIGAGTARHRHGWDGRGYR